MSRRAIGFDIGGTHARAAAVWAEQGSWRHSEVIKERWREQSAGDADPEALVVAIGRLIERVEEHFPSAPIPGRPAIGVGIAGQLDRGGEVVVNAPNLGWRELAFADLLEERLGVRPAVINDVNAILLGELHFGAAADARDVLAVYWGTGLGGAIAVGGDLVVGAGGNAGEIGHVKVPGRDEPCGCGERGCIEAIAGGASLLKRIAAHPDLRDVARGIDDLERLAGSDHPAATALLDELVDGVGHVLAGACTLLNPDVLLLGGGVLERAPATYAALADRVRSLTLEVCRRDLTVRSGELGDAAGPLGAGARAARRAP